tara:strand:+ start:1144 stop:1833 length:690 start_codon:yes stop_codon:yes gene_type:complete
MDAMREQGILPIALDLPGHGPRAEAPSRGFTLDDAIAAVDEKTTNLDHYDLIGYSMGGRIALHVALARPDRVRKLVLESASPGLSSNKDRMERIEEDGQLATSIEREGIADFVKRWEKLPIFASQKGLPPEVRDRVRSQRMENKPAALACALRGLGTGMLSSLWGRLECLECPTLLIVGASDIKFVHIARKMESFIPHSCLVKVEGVGHAVHLESPEMWLQSVVPFLLG